MLNFDNVVVWARHGSLFHFLIIFWVFYRITLRSVLICVLQNVFRRSTSFFILNYQISELCAVL